MSGFNEYEDYDALGLAELVKTGEVSAEDLVEEAIARVERVNPELNAMVHSMYVQARAMAKEPGDGPFAGVPFVLKDLLVTVPGVPTQSGSRFYRGWVPDAPTELYRRQRAAGLIPICKANTPEFGLMPVTEPAAFGATSTPWKLGHTSGGSSGGSAALVAARAVPMAHGGDGGGSIRIPASCCGLFGLKPTRGRTPAGPDASEHWNGFAMEHGLSLSVRDSAALLDATRGFERGAAYSIEAPGRPLLEEVGADVGKLRVAVHTEPAMPGSVHVDCIDAVEETVALLEELGHQVERVSPGHHPMELAQSFLTIVCANTAIDVEEAQALVGRKAKFEDFEPETWLLALIGGAMSASDLERSVRALQAESRRLAELYADYDVLLTPTLGKPPIRHGELRATGAEALVQKLAARAKLGRLIEKTGALEQAAGRAYDFIPFTPVANFTGQPSMSVPLHWNAEGLPIGSMFTARFGDEAVLFRLAAQLEEARPWRDKRPPVISTPS
ncbi:MAG: amidase [Deltaproteobacteria bacterium]|nr:amidase [Deltaproteobacteria bacterium]